MWILWLGLVAAGPLPKDTTQLLVVTTTGAEASTGTLHRFERARNDDPWAQIGEPWPIVVGERGLAAGLGLHAGILPRLPVKREGDGRSPAGVFSLTHTFGFGAELPGLRMPYLRIEESLECVDDPESRDYGRLLARGPAASWTSSQRMREIPDYQWGVVLAHNRLRKRGAGACVFLHAWSAPEARTQGCTAMAPSRIEELVHWLDDRRSPVLVQLTRDLYRDLSSAWELPEAPIAESAP